MRVFVCTYGKGGRELCVVGLRGVCEVELDWLGMNLITVIIG